MKRQLLTLLLAIVGLVSIYAQQKIYIHTPSGIIEKYTWEVDSITFKPAASVAVTNKPTAVDLGLSVKWANFNVGSAQETEAGYLLGWGDISGINRSKNLKYFPVSNPEGNIIGGKYDIATQQWGDLWRVPSDKEIQELITGCDWTWTTINSVAGYKVTSKVAGNSNYIFLPVTGKREGSDVAEQDVVGYYWTGVLDADKTKAIAYTLTDTEKTSNALARYVGCAIRPVYGKFIHPISVIASTATSISHETANINVTMSGSVNAITEYGICYAKDIKELDPSKGPKVSDTTVPVTNVKTFALSGLEQHTTYYYVAYALSDGNYSYSDTLKLTTEYKYAVPNIVDLGLSVKWASWNIGAKSEGEYGGYFGWGDPTGELMSMDATLYGKGVKSNDIKGTAYDMPHVQWGGKWRLPTTKEIEELMKCTWSYSNSYNGSGVKGWIVSNNGNQVFFPLAGWKRADNASHNVGNDGSYWTSELSETDPNYAYYGQFVSKEYIKGSTTTKNILMPIRAVYDEPSDNPIDVTPTLGPVIPEPSPNPDVPVVPVTPAAGISVDLGLSVKWADRNVGAVSPHSEGGYYAWGEVETKSVYDKTTYQAGYNHATGVYENLGNIGGTDYDVARKEWGGTWRMPTKSEVEELISNCDWKWTTQNQEFGYLITNKQDATKHIFLPAGGYMNGSSVATKGVAGKYWTSDIYIYKDETNGKVYVFNITEGSRYVTGKMEREAGLLIRPVMK